MQTKPIEVGGGKYRWQYEMSLFRNLSVGRNELYADGADFDFARNGSGDTFRRMRSGR